MSDSHSLQKFGLLPEPKHPYLHNHLITASSPPTPSEAPQEDLCHKNTSRASSKGGTCQVWVYSGRGSSQVWMKVDEGRGQRARQEISPARVGDHLDSMTKDNEH